MKLNKTALFRERAVRFLGKRGNVTLIQLMSYKSQFSTDVVLQCLVEKDVIIYKNIWVMGPVKPHGVIVKPGSHFL